MAKNQQPAGDIRALVSSTAGTDVKPADKVAVFRTDWAGTAVAAIFNSTEADLAVDASDQNAS